MRLKLLGQLGAVVALGSAVALNAGAANAQSHTCSATALNTCATTVGDFTFSNFSFGGGFTPVATDNFSFNISSGFAQVQLNFSPARIFPVSGSFTYDISVASPRNLSQAQANITGNVSSGGYNTSTSGTGLGSPATATAGNGNFVSFNPGVTAGTFTQTFAATGAGLLNSVGTFYDAQLPAQAPGPLPILGAGAAFGLSRKMRRRISQAV